MTCQTTNCVRVQCDTVAIEPQCLILSLPRGTDNQLEVTLTDGDRLAVVITNDTVDFVVKDEPNGSVIFSKSNGPGGHSKPGLGQTIFTIAPADTASASAVATTYWVYEVRRTEPSGLTRVHLLGDFVVRPTI